MPGTKVDGHDFIHDAIAAGAKAVISNGRDIGKLSVPQIKVANPRRATSIVAAEFYGHPSKDLTIIGITGTNGKTTTKDLLFHVLREEMNVMKTEGNFNSTTGAPLSLLAFEEDADFGIIEIGANKPGEIEEIVQQMVIKQNQKFGQLSDRKILQLSRLILVLLHNKLLMILY